mgnify:CR=1 FL=1|tara:strand:+ start:131 stop:310 length:180 start_codon:yes stop_codon:yes gene_type:complete
MLANIKFKAIEDLKKIRAEVSGQSKDNPASNIISMQEFVGLLKGNTSSQDKDASSNNSK